MALDRSLIGVRLRQPLFRLIDAKRAQEIASDGWFYGFHTGWDLWKGGLSSDGRLEEGQRFYFGEIYPSIVSAS